ncbi:MAG: hypothetical protein ACPGO3_14980 [Magnetospiraceae bacterium]
MVFKALRRCGRANFPDLADAENTAMGIVAVRIRGTPPAGRAASIP